MKKSEGEKFAEMDARRKSLLEKIGNLKKLIFEQQPKLQ